MVCSRGRLTLKNRIVLLEGADRLIAEGKTDVIDALSAAAPAAYTIGNAVKSGGLYAATHSVWFCAMEL